MASDPARSPGRPRQFDVDDVLDSALELFWEKGYRGTSTRQLEAAVGITQSSIYNTFGSKQQLLLDVIERYEARMCEEVLGLLDEGDDGLDAIGRFFEELGRWVVRNEHRGCMVVSLMAAEAENEKVAERVVAYRAKIRSSLFEALRRSGTMVDEVAERRAEVLLAAVLGLHVTARSSDDAGEVHAMLEGLEEQVAAWR